MSEPNTEITENHKLTDEQIRYVNASVLASKYKVSVAYVTLILKGDRETKSSTAKKIMEDAKLIITAYESSPNLNAI